MFFKNMEFCIPSMMQKSPRTTDWSTTTVEEKKLQNRSRKTKVNKMTNNKKNKKQNKSKATTPGLCLKREQCYVMVKRS